MAGREAHSNIEFTSLQNRLPRPPLPPEGTEPSAEWIKNVLQTYADLQARLGRTESPSHSPVVSTPTMPTQENYPHTEAQWHEHFVTRRPSLSLLEKLDFVSILVALRAVDNAVPPNGPAALNALVNPTRLAEWAFSLFAFILP